MALTASAAAADFDGYGAGGLEGGISKATTTATAGSGAAAVEYVVFGFGTATATTAATEFGGEVGSVAVRHPAFTIAPDPINTPSPICAVLLTIALSCRITGMR